MLILDQTKDFDRVNHKYLIFVLEHIVMKGAFLNLTKTLYTDVTSKIMINGKCSETITIERECHQGCPYSRLMVLFVTNSIPLIQVIKDGSGLKRFQNKAKHCEHSHMLTIIQ